MRQRFLKYTFDLENIERDCLFTIKIAPDGL